MEHVLNVNQCQSLVDEQEVDRKQKAQGQVVQMRSKLPSLLYLLDMLLGLGAVGFT